MYIPPAFRETDLPFIHQTMRAAGLASLVTVTVTANGLVCTPLPLFLDDREGEMGTLYGHVAKANPQWKTAQGGPGIDIYIPGTGDDGMDDSNNGWVHPTRYTQNWGGAARVMVAQSNKPQCPR
jgi:hypothetical protein